MLRECLRCFMESARCIDCYWPFRINHWHSFINHRHQTAWWWSAIDGYWPVHWWLSGWIISIVQNCEMVANGWWITNENDNLVKSAKYAANAMTISGGTARKCPWHGNLGYTITPPHHGKTATPYYKNTRPGVAKCHQQLSLIHHQWLESLIF